MDRTLQIECHRLANDCRLRLRHAAFITAVGVIPDGVELVFEEDALRAIAEKAIQRNTGARGLRSIIEETMTGLMFDLPSMENVKKVTITKSCVDGESQPVIE